MRVAERSLGSGQDSSRFYPYYLCEPDPASNSEIRQGFSLLPPRAQVLPPMPRFRRIAHVLFFCSVLGLISSAACAQNNFQPPEQLPELQSANPGQQAYSDELAAMTANPVLWQQYQALQTGAVNGGSACGCGGSPYDRCGCNPELFHWIDGPGSCDSWCVGPKWAVQADGLFLFRDDADWDAVINDPAVIADVGPTPTLVDQFDHAPGARLFATAYNETGFGMQIGYMGANDWHATLAYDTGTFVRTFDYETRLNSVEINFLPCTPFAWKYFGGFRYVEIDEDFADFTANNITIPPPATPPAATVAVVDTGMSYLLENRLIGFQVGSRRDSWQFGRWLTVEAFGNAGVYCNKFKRENVSRNVTTIITGDDLSTPDNEFSETTTEVRSTTRQDFAEIAFLGEAGISGVVRLNQCVALRSGYEVMVVDGMGQGLDAFFSPGIDRSTVLYHGLQFGIEYRR